MSAAMSGNDGIAYCASCARDHDWTLYRCKGLGGPKDDRYSKRHQLAPSHFCVPPLTVVQFGECTMTGGYRAALFASNRLLQTEEIVSTFYGSNPYFPSHENWEAKRAAHQKRLAQRRLQEAGVTAAPDARGCGGGECDELGREEDEDASDLDRCADSDVEVDVLQQIAESATYQKNLVLGRESYDLLMVRLSDAVANGCGACLEQAGAEATSGQFLASKGFLDEFATTNLSLLQKYQRAKAAEHNSARMQPAVNQVLSEMLMESGWDARLKEAFLRSSDQRVRNLRYTGGDFDKHPCCRSDFKKAVAEPHCFLHPADANAAETPGDTFWIIKVSFSTRA